MLLLPEVNVHRASVEIEVFSQAVLKEALVRISDVLRKIAVESE